MSEQEKQIAGILESIALRESADADQLLSALRDTRDAELQLRQAAMSGRTLIEKAGLKLAYLLVSSSRTRQVADKIRKEGNIE